MRVSLVVFLLMLGFQGRPVLAQDDGISVGVGVGSTFGLTDLDDGHGEGQGRAFMRFTLIHCLQGEFGLGVAQISGGDYRTELYPVDYHFVLSPMGTDFNPFLYAGAGMEYFKLRSLPTSAVPPADKYEGWVGFLPVGAGLQLRLSDQLMLEGSGGYNYTFTDNLNGAIVDDKKDAYWGWLIGMTAHGESGSADPDHDGLTNDQEKELGSDPKNPDTDGDGLMDGDEVNRYHTSPIKADSDGDGLNDGQEVNTTKTDPNKADTDGDGLNDGQEVTMTKTDPNKADTDGDGLNDGQEVNTTKTDPLKADTDGGSVNDGTEVKNGTDPLVASDDVPKKEELKVEVGKAIVLEGIVFMTASAEITPESESVLEIAYNTLNQNPDITVEIRGYTDSRGSRSYNMKLSKNRAESVKAWLVKKGIDESRMTAAGLGPDNPVGPNTTDEGRQKNRRIEFYRVK
jgi:outer membrane protein OmpA-like peptidoglycan-associated protein